ncbi:MAG: hypothetical protein LCI00_28715 [Chloroflexi bacterium]|nr:hypothetical protein [Chloroflexota bacterium]MCC6891530.1 hypothetical protein [Anaerolineae bacterium]
MLDNVWVFHGAGGQFASAVFSAREQAEAWIEENSLTGILTQYPVNTSAYDWAIANGRFTPKQERDTEPQFIQRFSSAHQEHYHYEDGKRASS